MMLAGFLLVPLLTAYIAGRALAELRAIKQIVGTVIIEKVLLKQEVYYAFFRNFLSKTRFNEI